MRKVEGLLRAIVLGCLLMATGAPVFAQETESPASERPGREVSLPQSEVKDTFFAYVLGIITAGHEVNVDNAQMREILTEFKSTLAVPFDLIDRVTQHTDEETGGHTIGLEFTRDVSIPIPFALLFYHPGSIVADQDLVWRVSRSVFDSGDGGGPVTVFDLALWRGSVLVNIDDWLEVLFSAYLEDTWIHHIIFFRWKGDWIGLLEGAGRRTGRILRAYFDFTKNTIMFPPPVDLEKAGRELVNEPSRASRHDRPGRSAIVGESAALAQAPVRGLPFARESPVKTLIACGQFAPAPGDIPRNLDSIRAQAVEAGRRGARILVLPELCLCGYPTAAEARARAVSLDGPEMARAGECARSAGVALCFGFAESALDGNLYNSMAYIDAEGTLRSLYRKVHLWVDEKSWAVPGGSFETFDAGGLRLGVWICYDTRFPESARALARSGATLGLIGSAWFGPEEEWELAVRARAMDNGMYVAGAAVQGAFDEVPFHGASLIVDPHGAVLARARRDGDDLIIAEHDDEVVRKFRSRLPLLDDLRPGAYG